jgi:hypothetical protein
MSLTSITSLFSQTQAGSVSRTQPYKATENSGSSGAARDSFGPAFEVSLSPQAQAITGAGNGSGVVQALMTDSVTGAGGAKINFGGSYKAGLFSVADTNGDRMITRDELSGQAVAGGASTQEADAMFSVNDENGDGQVSEQEFSETMATPVGNDSFSGRLSQMFDANGDGTISQAELDQMLDKSRQSQQAIEAAHERLGLKDGGSIGADELLASLTGAAEEAA